MIESWKNGESFLKNKIYFDNFIELFEDIIYNLIDLSKKNVNNNNINNVTSSIPNNPELIEELLKENHILLNNELFLQVFFSSFIHLNIDDFLSNSYDLILNKEEFPLDVNLDLKNSQFFNKFEEDELLQLVVKDFVYCGEKFLKDLDISYNLDEFLAFLFGKLMF